MLKRTSSERASELFNSWLTTGEEMLWIGWRTPPLWSRFLQRAVWFLASLAFYSALIWNIHELEPSWLGSSALLILGFVAAVLCLWLVAHKSRFETAYALTSRRVMKADVQSIPKNFAQLSLNDIEPFLIRRTDTIGDLRFADGWFAGRWEFNSITDGERVLTLIKEMQRAANSMPVPVGATAADALAARLYPGETILRPIQPSIDTVSGAWTLFAFLAVTFMPGAVGTAHYWMHVFGRAPAFVWLMIMFGGSFYASIVANRYSAYAITDRRLLSLTTLGAIPTFFEIELSRVGRVVDHLGRRNTGALHVPAPGTTIVIPAVRDIKPLIEFIRSHSGSLPPSRTSGEPPGQSAFQSDEYRGDIAAF